MGQPYISHAWRKAKKYFASIFPLFSARAKYTAGTRDIRYLQPEQLTMTMRQYRSVDDSLSISEYLHVCHAYAQYTSEGGAIIFFRVHKSGRAKALSTLPLASALVLYTFQNWKTTGKFPGCLRFHFSTYLIPYLLRLFSWKSTAWPSRE